MKQLLYIIPLLLFSFNFFFTIGKHPLVSIDLQNSVLDKKPIVLDRNLKPKSQLSYNNSKLPSGLHREKLEPTLTYTIGNHLVPLLHQQRHGGLPFYPFKMLYQLLGCKAASLTWHYLTSLTTIILLGILLFRVYDARVAFIAMTLLALDPIEITSYGIFFTEPLNKIGFLLILLLFQRKNYRSLFFAGLLIGINLYIRINFLWFLLAMLPFTYSKIRKNYKPVLAGALLTTIPYFALINLNVFFEELALVQQKMGFENFFWDLFNLIADKREFLRTFGHSLIGKTPLPLIILSLIAFIAPLFRKKAPYKVYLSLLIFIASVWLSIRTNNIYSIYFFGANLFVCTILALSIKKKEYLISSLIIITGLWQSLNWVIPYHKYGADNSVSYNLHKKIADDVDNKTIYTIGEADVGRLEYVSNQKITPTHLYETIQGNALIGTQLFNYLDHGTLLIVMNDMWSSWYGQWPPVEIKRWKELAKRLKVRIYDEKIYKVHGQEAAWIFSFEKEASNEK